MAVNDILNSLPKKREPDEIFNSLPTAENFIDPTASRDEGTPLAPVLQTGYEGMEYKQGDSPIAEAISTGMANVSSDLLAGVGDVAKGTGEGVKWAGRTYDMPTVASAGESIKQAGKGMVENVEASGGTGKYGIGSDILRAAPFTLATIPLAVEGGALAAGTMARVGAGKLAQSIAGLLGGSVPASAFEALTEAGGAKERALELGLSEADANQAGKDTFWANMKLLTGSNALQYGIAAPAGRKFLEAVTPDKILGALTAVQNHLPASIRSKAAIGAGILAEMGIEGFEEGQQLNEQRGALDTQLDKEVAPGLTKRMTGNSEEINKQNKPVSWIQPGTWDPEFKQNITVGAAMGGLFGLGANAMGGARQGLGEQPPAQDGGLNDLPPAPGAEAAPPANATPADTIMNNIMGQESGGNYGATNADSGAAGAFQIMPENWPAWSQEAGLPANVEMTPENQRQVASFKMNQYLQQFGSPQLVAAAWYAGPAYAQSLKDGKPLYDPNARFDKDGNIDPNGTYPSVAEYVAQTMGRSGETTNAQGNVPPAGANANTDQIQRQQQDALDQLNAILEENKISGEQYKALQAEAQTRMETSTDAEEINTIDEALKKGKRGLHELAKQYPDMAISAFGLQGQTQTQSQAQEQPKQQPGPVKFLSGQEAHNFNANNYMQQKQQATPLPTVGDIAAQRFTTDGQTPAQQVIADQQQQANQQRIANEQQLNALTGQQAQSIQLPVQDSTQGVEAVQQLKAKYATTGTPLQTADQVNLQRKLKYAAQAGDYAAAANIAMQLGDTRRAELFSNMVPQKTPKLRMTTADIKQNKVYNSLTDMEQLFIDNLLYHNVSIDSVQNELQSERDKMVQEQEEYMHHEADEIFKAEKYPVRNDQGSIVTSRHTKRDDIYHRYAKELGYSSWTKVPKKEQNYFISQEAVSQLRNAQGLIQQYPEVSKQFNELEATLNGIEQIRAKIEGALPEGLRSPESGGTGHADNIRAAADQAKTIGPALNGQHPEQSIASTPTEYAKPYQRQEEQPTEQVAPPVEVKPAEQPQEVAPEVQQPATDTNVPTKSEEQPVEQPPANSTGYSLGEFTHTKTGDTMYVAKPEAKLGPERYKEVAAIVKKHGGRYSNYSKDGALPGFLFKDAAKRDAFLNEANGQQETNRPVEDNSVHAKQEEQPKSEEQPAQGTKTTQQPVKLGRAGKATLKKIAANEDVNADLNKKDDPYAQDFIDFFNTWYQGGLDGVRPKWTTSPIQKNGNYFPPYLEDVIYKSGQKDAEKQQAKPQPAEKPVAQEQPVKESEQQPTPESKPSVQPAQSGDLPAIPKYFKSRTELLAWAKANGITTFKESPNTIMLYVGSQTFMLDKDYSGPGTIVPNATWSESKTDNLGKPISEFDAPAVEAKNNSKPQTKPETSKPELKVDVDVSKKQALKEKLLARSKPKKLMNFTDDSDEAMAKADAELKAELSNLSANPMFNPKLMSAALKSGAIRIQRGVNDFADWSAKMVDAIGEAIKPYLPSTWSMLNNIPEGAKFDADMMNELFEYSLIAYKEGATTEAALAKIINDDLGEEYASFAKMAYNGIKGMIGGDQNGIHGRQEEIHPVDHPAEKDIRTKNRDGESSGGRSDQLLESEPSQNDSASATDGNTSGNGVRDAGKSGGSREEVSESGNEPAGRNGTSKSGMADARTGGRSFSRAGKTGRKQSAGAIREAIRRRSGNGAGVSDKIAEQQRPNYHIENPEELIGGTPKVRFGKNRAAIEAFLSISEDGHIPTQDELDSMAAYTGWGSFGQELFQGNWTRPAPKDGWVKEDAWLRDHLGQAEWESAQRSIINAHYTDPITVKAMWDIAQKLGFAGGRVLEPSMGVGNFFGMMPLGMMEQSKLTGIELDKLTGGMAKLLYPGANIQIKGYQDSKTADDFYDLVIGNFPFSNIAPADRRYLALSPTLHDFFFLKGLDQVRAGGIVMSITSAGTMDKKGTAVRLALAKKAELVASFRLPSGAFQKYAGTSVVTDILIFKKREEPLADLSGETWINTGELETAHGKITVNQYYIDNPKNVLGTLDFGHGTTYGRPAMIVNRPNNLQSMVENLASRVEEGVYQPTQTKNNISYVSNNTTEREGSVIVGDKGELMVVQGERLAPADQVKKYSIKSEKDTNSRIEQIKGLIGIRNAYGETIDAERADKPETETLRKGLKKQYDKFVKAFGNMTDSFGLKYLKNIKDPSYAMLKALEIDGKAAAVFTQKTIRAIRNLTNPSVKDAFVMVRNQDVGVDVAEIAKLSGKSEEAVVTELQKDGAIFKTPTGRYEVSDVYLSGNVRVKLREAQDALESGDADMHRNIEELKKVMPVTVPYYKIEAKLGAPWVSTDDYNNFVGHLLGVTDTSGIDVAFIGGSYKVRFEDKSLNRRTEATTQWGIDHKQAHFDKLLNAAFNNTTVKITTKDDDGNETIDDKETLKANEKITKIREEFPNWIWKDSSRKIELENNYNESMNAIATPKYDGSFLEMPGMALLRGENPFSLRSHQINAIWRGIANNRGIYAHEVGTGKTYTMAGIAIESRRFGIARKPLLLAHNANSATVAKEINDMYPGAKVLYIESIGKDDVAVNMRRIANEDWDCIVMPHSLIDNLAMSEQTLMNLAAEEIANMEQAAIDAAAEDGFVLTQEMMDDPEAMKKVRSHTAKDLVKARDSIIEHIKKQSIKASSENAISFEETGIDQILVDEAHIFKKPPIATKMKMKGFNTGTSNRSLTLRFITDYVKALNNGSGVHVFSGTPITNSLVEIFNMMRYVMDYDMKKTGVNEWDTWFSTFADNVTDIELTNTGEYEPVTRLAAFVNVPELRRMVGQYMDIVFADSMPEFTPRATANGKTFADKLTDSERGELESGRQENPQGRPYKKIINSLSDMVPEQKKILDNLVKLSQKFKGATKLNRKRMMNSGDPASPLLVETAASNAGLDARLVDMKLSDHKATKVNRCAENVLSHYRESKLACQVIFMQRGLSDYHEVTVRNDALHTKTKVKVPALNLAKDIVGKLVSGGIAREQIAIVDGSVSKEKRKQIADDMNTGKLRVVIGNTETLGTGVNMQENLRAMHHLDAPWMPGDLEQRNGRGHRQGNKWNTVLEYRYLTNKLDGRRWQVLAVKAKFIKAFMQADEATRIIEGDAVDMQDKEDDISRTLSEASGDPRRMQLTKLQNDINKLENRERMHLYGIKDAHTKIKELTQRIAVAEDAVIGLGQDLKQYNAQKDKEFSIEIEGKTYDNRKDANEVLQKIAEKIKADRNAKKNERVHIGKYLGFDLYASDGWFGDVTCAIEGEFEHIAKLSTASIDSTLRSIKTHLIKAENDIPATKESIKKMEEMTKEPFHQQATLDLKRKLLKNLEADLLANPEPAPEWLVAGAPMGSDIYVDGKAATVEGHKANENGFFVVTDKGQFKADQVKDASGIAIYEEQLYENKINKLASGFDPTFGKFDDKTVKEVIQPAIDYGRKLIDQGAKNFQQWGKSMREYLGDKWAMVKPHIQAIWKHLNNERGSAALGSAEQAPNEATDPGESIRQAAQKAAERTGVRTAENVTANSGKLDGKMNVKERFANSMNVLAAEHPKLRPFFRMAVEATNVQENLRNHFLHRRQKWEAVLGAHKYAPNIGNSTYKQNKADLYELLWRGDLAGENYTDADVRAMGYNEQVTKAYKMVRSGMDHSYKLMNDIRQGIETKSETISGAELRELRKNQFVKILSEQVHGDGSALVTYRTPKLREQVVTMKQSELDELKQDSNVQIISERPLEGGVAGVRPQASGLIRGDEFVEVAYRSQVPPITKREGYIPHFFHEWFVMEKGVDEETGEVTYTMRESGKTMREAVAKANALDPKKEYVVQPKQFQFPGASTQAAVIGDMEYFKMIKKTSEDLEISLKDAQKFLDGKVHMKNRHRFMGNFLQRKGAEGYVKDLDWVLSHHFNQASRYVAMDPFKSKAISTYERLFGRWDKATHEGEASFARDYVNDVMGIPTDVEKAINDSLQLNPFFRKYLGRYFGDRPALELASMTTEAVAIIKLGLLNLSSAVINGTQFINIGSVMNDYGAAMDGVKRALKPSQADRVILHKVGIDANVMLDVGSGHSSIGQAKKWFKNTTIAFSLMELLMRRTAALGAYHKAIGEGKTQQEAIAYADHVNRKANFDYSVSDAPNAFRRGGPLSQVILQFKKYPIKQLELMSDIVQDGGLDQNARFWIPYLLLSGLWGIPFIGFIMGLLKDWLGWDMEDKVKKAAIDWAGNDKARQALVKLGCYGGLSAAGIDISKRAGIGDFGAMQAPKSVAEGFAALFGPAGSTVYQTTRQAAQGNVNEALKAFAPGVGNIALAVAGERKGSYGRVQTVYDDMYDRAVQGLGFAPVSVSMERDRSNIIYRGEEEHRTDTKQAIADYIKKPDEKSINKLRELGVTGEQVRNEMRRRAGGDALDRQERALPRKRRADYLGEKDFE